MVPLGLGESPEGRPLLLAQTCGLVSLSNLGWSARRRRYSGLLWWVAFSICLVGRRRCVEVVKVQ